MEAIKRDHVMPEKWHGMNLMKFNKAKVQGPAPGSSNYKKKIRLLGKQIENRPEKDLGMLVDKKLNMTIIVCSQPRKPVVFRVASKAMWPAGQERLLSHSALVRPHLESCVQFNIRKHGSGGMSPEEGQEDDQRGGASLP